MVGFTKHDSITTNQKLIAGVLSGVMTRFITQPVDVVKLRLQLIKKAKRRSPVLRITKKILTEEGVRAFWQGHNLGQIHSILSVSSQFYAYELTTELLTPKDQHLTPTAKTILSLICGAIGGCISTTLVIPLEVIRVRQVMLHGQYRGLFRGAKKVYESGGFFAFYEGLNAALLQMGPQSAINFTTFRFLQTIILSVLSDKCSLETIITGKCQIYGHETQDIIHKPEHLALASAIAGSISGLFSKSVTYPLDLFKRRLQLSSHVSDKRYKIPKQVTHLAQCKTLTECFIKAYKKEGIKGFFRGWSVTIYKAQLTSVVAFTSYEMFCYAFRQYSS